MSSRYRNLMFDRELGLLSLPLTVLFNPAYYLLTLFVPAKFIYFGITLAAMGFLPLFNRNFPALVLWIPFVVMNLSNNYPYQFEFFFQYSYGSHALLLVISLMTFSDILENSILENRELESSKMSKKLNLKKMKKFKLVLEFKYFAVSLSLALAILSSSIMDIGNLQNRSGVIDDLFNPSPILLESREIMAKIPRDKVIWSDGAYTIELGDVEFLYDLYYHKPKEGEPLPDLIIVQKRYFKRYSKLLDPILEDYFEKSDISGDLVWVYELKTQ